MHEGQHLVPGAAPPFACCVPDVLCDQELDLNAGEAVVLEALPARGRVNFRTICGAGGKELGEPMIELDDIAKRYTLPGRDEEVTALRSISMKVAYEVYPIMGGEFVILRGPSGGGKTTLLNIIGCIDSPTAGSLRLFGSEILPTAKDAHLASLRLSKIGFVFQTFNLLATMSAFENVLLPMTLLGKLNATERRARATRLLTQVGLADRMQHLPSELSGGEQQRVTIARALANDPDILLLDEPTGDLDSRNTIDIMDLLLGINLHQRKTMVMVTHNPDVECYGDRVVYIQDGVCVKQCLNAEQSALDYDRYMDFLNAKNYDGGAAL
jgi:putative ABC transport system ATP-binding protein